MGAEWIPIIGTVVAAIIAGVGYLFKRKWDERTADKVDNLKEIKFWQDKCYTMMQERIDYEVKRRESADTMRSTNADLAIALRDLAKQKDTQDGNAKTRN